MTNLKIHPFIFSWRRQYGKAKEKEEQLSQLFDNVTVINSDEENEEPHWVNVGDSFYFTNQFMKAVELFDGDVLLHVQADASFSDWKGLVETAQRHYDVVKWGVYAPDVDWTEWNAQRTNVVPMVEPGLFLVACPDCTCWMIHKDIIDKFKSMKLDMSDQNLGFGIDMFICALAHMNRRAVFRNYNFKVDHPRGTGYNVNQAHTELNSFLAKIDPQTKSCMSYIYREPKNLIRYYVG